MTNQAKDDAVLAAALVRADLSFNSTVNRSGESGRRIYTTAFLVTANATTAFIVSSYVAGEFLVALAPIAPVDELKRVAMIDFLTHRVPMVRIARMDMGEPDSLWIEVAIPISPSGLDVELGAAPTQAVAGALHLLLEQFPEVRPGQNATLPMIQTGPEVRSAG